MFVVVFSEYIVTIVETIFFLINITHVLGSPWLKCLYYLNFYHSTVHLVGYKYVDHVFGHEHV